MSVWHVTNNKLYSGEGTSDPVFIVGTEFSFGTNFYSDPTTNMTSWTNSTYQSNRAAAGNAVIFWHSQYFADSGDNPSDAGQKYINRFQEHYDVDSTRKLKYFSFDMNNWISTGSWAYRGSHTWKNATYGGINMTNGNGHWTRIPKSNSGDNLVGTDTNYFSNYPDIDNTTYWYPDSNRGNMQWHLENLKRVKTGTTNGTNHYDRFWGWHLMDEPTTVRIK